MRYLLLALLLSVCRADSVMWIEGGSMVPAIPAFKHAVMVSKPLFGDLKKGMVVVYVHPKHGQIVCHRLFKQMSPTEWWAKGDANPLPDDAYVTPTNYVGVVVAQDDTITPKECLDKQHQ